MRGFPKVVATPEDVKILRELYPDETDALVKRLYNDRLIWQDAGPVAKGEVVKESADVKVVDSKTESGAVEQRKQALVEDPDSLFFKLGLKAEDVGGVEPIGIEPVGDPVIKIK